jgi:hypothetical protein
MNSNVCQGGLSSNGMAFFFNWLMLAFKPLLQQFNVKRLGGGKSGT